MERPVLARALRAALLLAVFAGSVVAVPNSASGDVIARVIAVQGAASLNDGTPVERGTALQTGSRILAGERARVRIRFIGGSLITLGAGADFEVVRYEPADQNSAQQAVFRLLDGALLAVADGIAAEQSDYTIETTAGSMGIRGTIVWGGYFIPGQADYVLVRDGPVALSNEFGDVLLSTPGQGTTVPVDENREPLERPDDPTVWSAEKVFDATMTIAF